MDNEKLTISWDQFTSNAPNTLKHLFSDTDFSDVTLVCQGDKQIPAHKFILAASSKFFRAMLTRNLHPKPLIYLKGVEQQELELMVRFIYTGECEVSQSDLASFLDTGNYLEINGLNELQENTDRYFSQNYDQIEGKKVTRGDVNEQSVDKVGSGVHSSEHPSEHPETREESVSDNNFQCSRCKYKTPSKQCLMQHKENIHNGEKRFIGGENESPLKNNIRTNETIEEQLKKINSDVETIELAKIQIPSANEKGYFPCDECELEAKSTYALKNHKLAVHIGFRFSCDQCSYQNKSKNCIKTHKKAAHEGVLYGCDFCDYKTGLKVTLLVHKKTKHSRELITVKQLKQLKIERVSLAAYMEH